MKPKTKTNKILIISSILILLGVLGMAKASFAAPVIFYTDILSGPNTGGENNNGAYLSIFGKGFGATQGTSKIYINNTEVAAYKYWGASIGRSDIQQITIQPGPKVSSGPIKVVVANANSNTDHTFTLSPGDIYFVSLSGDDATAVIGDITKPFRNVEATHKRTDFGPGDFIIMREGNWADYGTGSRFVRLDKGGTMTNPIVFMGYPGEDVVIDLSQESEKKAFASYLQSVGLDHIDGVVIANLKISKGSGTSCCTIEWGGGGNSVWNYFRVVNIDVAGGGCGDGLSNTIMNVNKAFHSKIFGLHIHDADHACTANKHHLLYFANLADDFEVGWSEFNNDTTGSYPIQLNDDSNISGSPTITNITVHDSIVHDTTRGIMARRGVGAGIKFYSNIFYNTGTDQTQNMSGIAINNNMLQAEVEIYNNTFYGQDAKANGAFMLQDAARIVIKNNIIQTASSEEQYYVQGNTFNTSALIASNNLWFGSSQSIPVWDTNPFAADPKFVDPTSPSRNFHLQLGSPAIDAGVNTLILRDFDGTLRPQGLGYDLGVFEFVEGTPSDTTPPAAPTGLTVN